MKGIFAIVFLILITAVTTNAQLELIQPELNVTTDKDVYQTGDRGKIIITLNTYGLMKNAEIEATILSPENVIIGGAIIYTDIPERISTSKGGLQTEQVILQEDLDYIQPEKAITRVVNFEVPSAAYSGEYNVNVRAISGNMVLEKSTSITIFGTGVIESILLIYLLAIIIFIGMKYYSSLESKKKISMKIK